MKAQTGWTAALWQGGRGGQPTRQVGTDTQATDGACVHIRVGDQFSPVQISTGSAQASSMKGLLLLCSFHI